MVGEELDLADDPQSAELSHDQSQSLVARDLADEPEPTPYLLRFHCIEREGTGIRLDVGVEDSPRGSRSRELLERLSNGEHVGGANGGVRQEAEGPNVVVICSLLVEKEQDRLDSGRVGAA